GRVRLLDGRRDPGGCPRRGTGLGVPDDAGRSAARRSRAVRPAGRMAARPGGRDAGGLGLSSSLRGGLDERPTPVGPGGPAGAGGTPRRSTAPLAATCRESMAAALPAPQGASPAATRSTLTEDGHVNPHPRPTAAELLLR